MSKVKVPLEQLCCEYITENIFAQKCNVSWNRRQQQHFIWRVFFYQKYFIWLSILASFCLILSQKKIHKSSVHMIDRFRIATNYYQFALPFIFFLNNNWFRADTMLHWSINYKIIIHLFNIKALMNLNNVCYELFKQ